jgi:DNA-binding response OmpR family regulator
MSQKKRILIIEDEADIVRGLTDVLTFEGYDVRSAGLGRDGAQTGHPAKKLVLGASNARPRRV